MFFALASDSFVSKVFPIGSLGIFSDVVTLWDESVDLVFLFFVFDLGVSVSFYFRYPMTRIYCIITAARLPCSYLSGSCLRV